jgi:hypothetical protein
MDRILRGKFMVRRSKLKKGKNVLIICGVFDPMNFNIEDINTRDEMWVSDIVISGGIRFSGNKIMPSSPEDFLSNENDIQNPKVWENKSEL